VNVVAGYSHSRAGTAVAHLAGEAVHSAGARAEIAGCEVLMGLLRPSGEFARGE